MIAAAVLNRALMMSVFGFSVAPAQTPATLEPGTTKIEYSRFWRENTGTLIDAVVSYSVKGTGTAAASIEFRVVDRNGVELMKQTVPDSTRLDAALSSDKAVQLAIPLQFVVAPGEYTLNVVVSLGEQRDSAQARISAFTEAPLMSDLLVSSSIRVLKEGDSASVAESRKGSLAIQRQPQVVLDASGAKLWYYLELYGQPSQKDSAALAFSVNAPDGKSVLNLQRKLALGDRGRIDAGNIPLLGIPQGSYRLNVQANAGARTEQRQADFSVAQIAAMQPRSVAPPAGTTNRQLYERYFAPDVRSDSAIADLVGALRLAPPARAFPAFAEKAEPQVQRDALARYFESLDPEPATETHELLDEYIKRLAYVNRQFTEREGRRAGYHTPRGRIFLKYGGPDQSQLIPQGRRMVEVWKYSQQRGLKFVFLDETGFGHFTLVMTNDPNEQSIADWENRIGDADVVRAVLAF